MWLTLRKMASRGRSPLPPTFWRMRSCTARLMSCLLFCAMSFVLLVPDVAGDAHSLQFDLGADADDFELPRIAIGAAGDGVLHQGARQPVNRRVVVACALGDQLVTVDAKLNAGGHIGRQLAFRAAHLDHP